VLLLLVAANVGCNPWNSVAYFLMPEPRIPPECALTDKERETKVVLLATTTGMELRPELFTAEQDLVERMSTIMRKRYEENGDKVKIVPPYQVKSFLAKQTAVLTPHEIGKHFDADYVVYMEIGALSLYKKGSSQHLYLGSANINVSVTAMSDSTDQGRRWERDYAIEYPKTGEVVADSLHPTQFRAAFLNRVATDLARFFTTSETSNQFD
jgi:hypothetical protein